MGPAQPPRRVFDATFTNTLIEHTSDLVVVFNTRGDITYVAPSVERLLGSPPESVVGRNIRDLIHVDDIAIALRDRQNVHAGPNPFAALTRVVRVRHRNGQWRSIETVTTPLATGHPSIPPTEFLTNGRDVTDRLLAESALRQKQAVDALLAGITTRFVRHGSRDFEANLLRAIEEMRAFFGLDRVGIWRSPGDDGVMTVTHEVAAAGLEIVSGSGRVPRLTSSDIAALAPQVADGELVICHADHDPHGLLSAMTVPDAAPMRSFVLVPMLTDGRLIGFLNLVSLDQAIELTGDARAVFTALSAIFTTALARQASEHALAHQAMHDSLTGLANRALLLDRLELATARARRAGAAVGLLFIDLDDFKGINDTFGHVAGDDVLAGVADRLAATCRAEDTVARLGGDEFIVLIEGSVRPESAMQLAERIYAALGPPIRIANQDLTITASIGVAVEQVPRGVPNGRTQFRTRSQAHDVGHDAGGLLRKADIAMYRAKTRGQNRSELFTGEMEVRTRERFQLVEELRDVGFERGLRLDYQPLVRLADRHMIGVEALVRWQHPTRGLLPPGAFIEMAEQTNAIHSIGAWVIDTAFGQLASWLDARPGIRGDFRVAVNLSPRQMYEARLVRHVETALLRHGLEPSMVVFEVTEGVYAHGPEVLSRMLELRALGVALSIDDFGTGYSSLAYLRNLPIDEIKIDRHFVQGLGSDSRDTALVRAILGLAREFDLEVVAEGVETELQRSELIALGCLHAQGYLFGRPEPPRELRWDPSDQVMQIA